MTLLFAKKTDKEVYLASDGIGQTKLFGEDRLMIIDKFIKVNDHVEILIAGNLEVARGYYTSAQHALWDKGLYERDCDACEIAKALEQEINPSFESLIESFEDLIKSFESLIKSFRNPFIKSVLCNINENDSVLAFLKDDWPLEIFVGGWDKDENGDFVYPVIYSLENETHYKKRKIDTKDFVLGGDPDFYPVARRNFKKFLPTDASNSSIEIGRSIDSCYKKIIRCEPLHIARITKDGYKLWIEKNEMFL